MVKMNKSLAAHIREFRDAAANLMFEITPNGVWFPKQHAMLQVQGEYAHRVNGGDWVIDKNLIPTEGLTYLMGLLGATSKEAAWYIALYAGAVSPAAGWTSANFSSTASEITSGTEGYSQANRVTWSPAAAAAGAINNNASPASFTIVTASSLIVNGVGMLSAAAKGATTGVLVSASRFGAQRELFDTDVLDIKYAISATAA